MPRARLVLLAAPLLLAGCSTVGAYQPAFFDQGAPPAEAPALDGQVLVVTSPAGDGFVFEGPGTTGSGPDSVHVLQLPLGVIAREAALKAFGEAFRGGAVPGSERPPGAPFTAVVAPKVTDFSWAWLQGQAESLQVHLEVSVALLDDAGHASWERRYLATEAKAQGFSSVAALLSWLTHQAALKAMRQAARDLSPVLAPSAAAALAAPAPAEEATARAGADAPVSAPAPLVVLPPTLEPPPRPPRPVEPFVESGLGVGTTSLALQLDGGETYRINTGGIRLVGGVRFLRLADRRLETRASVGLSLGPPLVALKVPVPGFLFSFDAEVTEDLRLGDLWVGAGWYQRLAVRASGDGGAAASWSGRPTWVAHLERTWNTTFTMAALGFRIAGERLVSDGGVAVNGVVLGFYVSLTGDLVAPSSPPPAPEAPEAPAPEAHGP